MSCHGHADDAGEEHEARCRGRRCPSSSGLRSEKIGFGTSSPARFGIATSVSAVHVAVDRVEEVDAEAALLIQAAQVGRVLES